MTNKVGSAISGGILGAAGLGLAALPMLPKMGFLDPLTAGISGWSAAGGLAGGVPALAAGAAAALPAAAVMGAGAWALNTMSTGMKEQAQVQGVLGQMNFINPMSRSGRGFSRQASVAIASMVRQMQEVPEMMTSMSELTRIMDRLVQSGMMTGARDVETFGRKFKQVIHTLKDISKIMGTTMEEALPFFQEARQSGFFTTADILKNALNRQITSGLTGMNQQQISSLQAAGAQMSFQMFGNRRAGARLVTRLAQQLGTEREMGFLSNEQLLELTGAEGGEGINRLSRQMAMATMRLSRSPLGQALAMAVGEVDKSGRFTGGIDETIAARIRRGELGRAEILRLARQKTASRTARMSFAAQRGKIATNVASNLGEESIALQLKGILGEHGFQDPNALRLALQRMGLDERTADVVASRLQNMSERNLVMNMRSETERLRVLEASGLKEKYSLGALNRKIGVKLRNIIEEPIKKIGENLDNAIKTALDEAVDDMLDRRRYELTQEMSTAFSGAMAGSSEARTRLAGYAHGMGQYRVGLRNRFTDLTGTARDKMRESFGNMLPGWVNATGGLALRGVVRSAGEIYGSLIDWTQGPTRGQLIARNLTAFESSGNKLTSVSYGTSGKAGNVALARANEVGVAGGFLSKAYNTYKLANPLAYAAEAALRWVGTEGMARSIENFTAGGVVETNQASLAKARQMALDLSKGILSDRAKKALLSPKGRQAMENIKKKIANYFGNHRGELVNMTDDEKLDALSKFLAEDPDAKVLQEAGVSLSEMVYVGQKHAGYEGGTAGVDFSRLTLAGGPHGMLTSQERKQLAEDKKNVVNNLAQLVGENKSKELKALLENDSAMRRAFIEVLKNPDEYQELFGKGGDMSAAAKKLHISTENARYLSQIVSNISEKEMGAAKAAVTQLVDIFNIESGSALISQMHKNAALIGKRAKGLGGVAGEKMRAFAESLKNVSSMGDVLKLASSGEATDLIKTVAGLRGSERQEALAAFGGAGAEAVDIYGQIHKLGNANLSANRARAMLKRLGFTDEIMKRLGIKGKVEDILKGGLRGKEEVEKLGEVLSTAVLAGGIGVKGTSTTSGMTRFAELMDNFAKTTSTFAQLVLDSVDIDKQKGKKIVEDMFQINKDMNEAK